MNKRSLIFSALIFGLHPQTQQFLSVLRPYYVSRLSQACVNCLTSLAIYFELSPRGILDRKGTVARLGVRRRSGIPRSFSDRGWIRGLGFEAGGNRGGRRGVVRRRRGD